MIQLYYLNKINKLKRKQASRGIKGNIGLMMSN